MGKALLLTIVLVPVLAGMQAARTRSLGLGLRQLLVMLLTFDVAYLILLYYLRYKWV